MNRWKQFFRTLLQGLFEYVLLFPIILSIGILLEHYLDFSLWIWLLVYPVILTFGIAYKMLLKKQSWWMYGGISLLMGLGPLLFMPVTTPTTWILVMILPVISLRGMLYATRPWHAVLPISFLWIGGFSIYFGMYFIFKNIDMFSPYQYLITTGGVFFVFMTMFVSNSERLKKSTLDNSGTPYISPTMKRQNKIILGITIGVILIGNLRVVQNGFKAIIGYIVRFIFSSGDEEEAEFVEENLGQQSGEMMLPEGDNGFLYPLMKFLEKIMIAIFYIGIVAAIIVLIFLLMKKSRVWLIEQWKTLIQFLKNLTNRQDEDKKLPYIDEKETVFDWNLWKRKQKNKAKGLFGKMFRRQPRWDTLSNEEKVRIIYREIVERKKSDFDYRTALTARETLDKIKEIVENNDEEIDLLRKYYEATRYSQKDVNFEKIKDIYTLIENK